MTAADASRLVIAVAGSLRGPTRSICRNLLPVAFCIGFNE